MGGKPLKTTPADQRLKRNNPNAGKKSTQQPNVQPIKYKPMQQKDKN